jgi:N-acyl-phosphatidylethanolamine-hydrolysing phospholipase D
MAGQLVATDPVWSKRISGLIPRQAPPDVALEALPPLDIVTVSHNHYDHLCADAPAHRPRATYVTFSGNGAILHRAGLDKIVELEWWHSCRIGDLEITAVPARHWSMRAPWNRNEMLWSGFVYRGPEGVAYHSGDTALFDGFAEIGRRAGPIDWAMLPIGAYEPRWFMEPQHMNPEDAVEAFERLGARNLVAMHWGTFKLTDEPLGEPPTRLRARFAERGLGAERLWLFDIGETRALGGRPEARRLDAPSPGTVAFVPASHDACSRYSSPTRDSLAPSEDLPDSLGTTSGTSWSSRSGSL